MACVLATTTFQLLAPWVLKYAIDDLNSGVTRRKLALYAGLLLSISLVRGVFLFLMRRIIIGASRDIEYDIRNDFFSRLEQLSLGYYHSHRTGDLMSRATNDLNAVRMMIGPAIMYSANTVLVFVVAIILMLTIDLRLTLIALIPLPFVSLSVRYFGSAIHKRFEAIQAQLSDVSAVVQEALSGVRVVRAYRQEAHELGRFRASNEEYLRRNRVLIRLQGAFYPSMTFFLGLGSLLVLWLGSRDVIHGKITLGEFVAFNGYLVLLAWPMIAFGWVTNILQRGFASWKRMLDVLDQVPGVNDAGVTEAGRKASLDGDIEIRNLTFQYPTSERPVLEGVSLRIAAGETVAFVGSTGSGKSTLINLLPRLYDPPRGAIFIGGVDIREIPLERLRGAIGFVPQEPFLFSDTIGGNVAFGVPSGGPGFEDAIRHAAAVARLDKDVEEFPRGYDTTVGERGITLSGGQKQRTALARAIMIDPRILILDDALSAVDTYTEEEILSRLRGVMDQRTSIIVSHRISTVRQADQIFVLENGRVAERGRHDTLVAHGGLYAALYRKQLLEEELEAS
jgi:ATP-binding cassette subfamily B protein